MVTNNLARTFVENLCSAFCRYPIGNETKKLYSKKLSGWALTRDQWDGVIDRLVAENADANLPSLAIIFTEIRRQQEISKSNNPLGWAYFKRNEKDYAIRIKIKDHVWVVSDLVSTDTNGIERHLQSHVGEPVAMQIPEDATDYHIAPDDPARPKNEDIPTDAERIEIIREINEKLTRIGGRL